MLSKRVYPKPSILNDLKMELGDQLVRLMTDLHDLIDMDRTTNLKRKDIRKLDYDLSGDVCRYMLSEKGFSNKKLIKMIDRYEERIVLAFFSNY
jgi:hypothetical protein